MQYKKEEVKQRIVTAAINEFEKYGFNGALTKNIAKQSNVPVGNLYRYFSSKSEMFDAAVEQVYNNFPYIINRIYEKEKDKSFKVKDLAKDIAASIMDIYNQYSKQLIILVFKSKDTKYCNFMQEIYELITKLLLEKFFDKDNVQGRIMCEIISKGFADGLFELLKNGEKDTFKEMSEKLILFYFYNIEERI